ncbi:MAG: hypothetical protein ACFFBD_27440 [Candidatus Hodarchaeota archaeon]
MNMFDALYGLILIIEAIISVSCGIFIIRRDSTRKLNQIFLLVMVTFSLYFFFESIVYLFQIYDLNIINLFRDLSVSFSTAASVLLLFTALLVQYGEGVVENKRNIMIGFLVILILLFFALPNDTASITQNFGLDYLHYHTEFLGRIVSVIIPGVFVLYALFQYINVRRSSNDSALRQKLLRLTIGLTLILLAIAYLALFSFFRYPAHILFFSGLCFLFWAFM